MLNDVVKLFVQSVRGRGSRRLAKAWPVKRRMRFQGLPISIETDVGDVRKWSSPDGTSGETVMRWPYGYIRGTEGADAVGIEGETGYSRTQNDHVDVYVGPDEAAEHVYVVHQMAVPEYVQYDEDKCFLGFGSGKAVIAAFKDHRSDGDRAFGGLSRYTVPEFKRMLEERRGMPLLKATRPTKYIRREPTGDPKRPYRYYYAESASTRDVTVGTRLILSSRRAEILSVDDNGDITFRYVGEDGGPVKVSPDEWAGMMARHFGGAAYSQAMGRRATRAVNAIIRAFPKGMFIDRSQEEIDAGATGERSEQIYAEYASVFRRHGIGKFRAVQAVDSVLRRGAYSGWSGGVRQPGEPAWDEKAKAAMLSHILGARSRWVLANQERIQDGAENLAAGDSVSAGNVNAVIALDAPSKPGSDKAAELAIVAEQADVEMSRIDKARAQAQAAPSPKASAKVLAATLNAPAMTQMSLFGQAFPAAEPKDKVVKRARKTVEAAPSAAPPRPPKREGSLGVFFAAGEGGKPIPMAAQYKLMEAEDVVASHVAGSFQPRQDYPEGIQERAYHRDKSEQYKVQRNAARMRPEFVFNTNPDAVNGPPVITEDGVVLGGNSRTMSMQLLYQDYPEQAANLREYMAAHAYEVGLHADDVKAMKNPVLVRVVTPPDTSKRGLQVMVRAMNETFTQAMDPRTMQVAMGRRLTDRTMADLSDTMSEDETLNAFLSSSRSSAFVEGLHRDGVIDERNANQYVAKNGRLNEDGKTLVERILVGRIVEDADILSNTQPSIVSAMARVVPHMLQAETHGDGYRLRDELRVALSAYTQLRAAADDGRIPMPKKGLSARKWREAMNHIREGLPGIQEEHPIFTEPKAMGLFEAIVKNSPTQLVRIFREYANQAAMNPEGQSDMLRTPLTPDQVFSDAVNVAEKRRKQAEEEKAAEEAAKQARAEAAKNQSGLFASMDYVPHVITLENLAKAAYQPSLFGDDGDGDQSAPAPVEPPSPARGGPPPGYHPVPGSRKGGYRKRTATGYDYWYPDKASSSRDDSGGSGGKSKRKPKAESKARGRKHVGVGEHVWGSRADIAGLSLADLDAMTPAEASKAAVKAKLWPKYVLEDEVASGSTPGAVLLKTAVRALVAPRPPIDTAPMRRAYVRSLNWLTRSLDAAKTVDDVHGFLQDWHYSSQKVYPQSTERLAINRAMGELMDVLREGGHLAKALRALGDTLAKGAPYVGPRGGKWADPQHKVPYVDNMSGRWRDRKRRVDTVTMGRFRRFVDAAEAKGSQYSLKKPLENAIAGYRKMVADKDLPSSHPAARDPSSRMLLAALVQGSGVHLERVLRAYTERLQDVDPRQTQLGGPPESRETLLAEAVFRKKEETTEHVQTRKRKKKERAVEADEARRQGSLF